MSEAALALTGDETASPNSGESRSAGMSVHNRRNLQAEANEVVGLSYAGNGDPLRAIAESYAKLAEASNDRTLYDKTFSFIDRVTDDYSRDKILDGILSSKFAVDEVSKLRLLTSYYSGDVGKAKALARILMTCSHPELLGKKQESINNDSDHYGWR
jgi:hypothetical protein